MSDTLHQLCDDLFGAFVAHDLDRVDALMAPDASVTQNGVLMTWPESRAVIEGITTLMPTHQYVNVRRVIGDGAVVEEHDVAGETADGQHVLLHACVVIRVDDRGLITTVHEYVDPTPLTKLA